jgi:tetratricopeptide (TPR) repeat protein
MSDELQNLIERFKRAQDSRLFAPLADAYRKNGNVDTAIEILERGIERYPDYSSAHVILGKCYYDKGATERARAEFQRVIDLDAENLVALKFMGDILLAENRRSEAADYFKRVLAIDPTNEEVAKTVKEMEEIVSVKDIDLGDGKTVRDERPRELATMTLAGIYAAQGYYNRALKIYGEVLAREPGNREAREMVDKLQTIMDSTNAEQGKAFSDSVLTISVDDISEDIAASTAGHGGAEAPGAVAEPVREAAEAPADVSESEEAPSPPAGEPQPHEAQVEDGAPTETTDSRPAEPGADEGTGERPGKIERRTDDMAHFREWIKRLKKE